MSSFFTKPASERKRKRDAPQSARPAKRPNTNRAIESRAGRSNEKRSRKERQASPSEEDEISGSDSDSAASSAVPAIDDDESESEDENETAAERRLRLAERYLENIREEVDTAGFDAAEIDRDYIAERLREDVAETKGKLYHFIAQDLDFGPAAERSLFTADQDCITGVAATENHAYTASKNGVVVKWELPPSEAQISQTERKSNIAVRRTPKFVKSYRSNRKQANNAKYLGHTDSILCVAASESGKFLATGGSDKRIVVWDVSQPDLLKPIKVLTHHRDSILSLSFRKGTHTLFSGSADRTIKIWGLDELVYIETLFGHQDHVTDLAGMSTEMCVSVGTRDRTARVWKVVEESQLVFRGGGSGGHGKRKDSKDLETDVSEPKSFDEGSIDRVTLIDNETFVTGSDNGTLALWSINRKKPIHVIPMAHGYDSKPLLESSFADQDLNSKKPVGREKARWITALTSLPFSDVVVSGSWDGSIRVWRVTPDRRRLESLGAVGASSTSMMPSTLDSLNAAESSIENGGQLAKGIITDLAIVERGERGMEELCIIASTSKQHRLGRWPGPKCKNGALLFRVWKKGLQRPSLGAAADGDVQMVNGGAGDDDNESLESPATLQ